jgi:hypothetical protein
MKGMLLFQFLKKRKWGSKRPSRALKVTQLVNGSQDSNLPVKLKVHTLSHYVTVTLLCIGLMLN